MNFIELPAGAFFRRIGKCGVYGPILQKLNDMFVCDEEGKVIKRKTKKFPDHTRVEPVFDEDGKLYMLPTGDVDWWQNRSQRRRKRQDALQVESAHGA